MCIVCFGIKSIQLGWHNPFGTINGLGLGFGVKHLLAKMSNVLLKLARVMLQRVIKMANNICFLEVLLIYVLACVSLK